MKRHTQDSFADLAASIVFFAVFLLAGRAHADLIAHWPLDESGEDLVGGFDGVESGGVEFGVPGANDNTGDATSFFDGLIDVPFAEDLNPEDFTIAVWARSTGGSGHRSVITSRYDGIVFGGGNLDGFNIYANPGDQWQFWTGDGESAVDNWDILPGPQVELDEWQHLAITFDSQTNTKNFYINGILEASTIDQRYQPVTTDTRTLHIGGGGDMGDEFRWVGDIDDLGLWDGVLSEDDIIDIMEEGVLPPASTEPEFRRGDAANAGTVNLTSAIFILNFLFTDFVDSLACREAGDINNDGLVNLTDAVNLLNHLFGTQAPPAPPGLMNCGPDPDEPGSPGDLGCEEYTTC